MGKQQVGKPHSLQLIDADEVISFAEHRQQAIMRVGMNCIINVELTPGTLNISDQLGSDGVAQKRHTFQVKNLGAMTRVDLESLRYTRLMAQYTDARGTVRVSGSPLYPLKLTYTADDGVLTCTLTGRAPWLDLELSDL